MLRDVARDFVLDTEQIGRLPVVLLTPQLRTVRRADELHFDVDEIVQLAQLAEHDGVHAELFPDRTRIRVFPFVSKHGTAG